MTDPTPWPGDVSPALFDDQRDDVLRAWQWQTHMMPLVVVRCGPCGEYVMNVQLPCRLVPDDSTMVEMCPLGPLIRGTRRSPWPELDLAYARGTIGQFPGIDGLPVATTGNPPRKAPRDILQHQWLALLDQVTAATLPAWCNRHGDRLVDVGELRRQAAASLADGADGAPRRLDASPRTR